MSETVEFRRIKRMIPAIGFEAGWYEGEHVVQYRTKQVIIGVLGVSLSSWSAWQDLPTILVNYDTGQPL